MDMKTFRAVIALLLCIVVAGGLYLGYHATHHEPPRCQGWADPTPHCRI